LNCIVLSHLEGFGEFHNMFLWSVEWEAISEDGEDEGVKDFSPVCSIDATNQVT
jgi:hypothetical protein